MRWRLSVLTLVGVFGASALAFGQPVHPGHPRHPAAGGHHGAPAHSPVGAATPVATATPEAIPPTTAPTTPSAGAPVPQSVLAGPGTPDGDGGVIPSTAPSPASAIPFEDGGTLTGEQYQVRLRDLEARVDALKEEIFRSKARLSLLAESVLQNVVGGSRAMITHQNEMGGGYRLVSLVYSLDGAPIISRNDDTGAGPLGDQTEFRVYNGQIGSGDHNLGVALEYVGAGLPYMKGYRFRVRSTQSFSVPEGKAIQIRVVGYEKGGPFEPPESRPAIRYIQRIMSLRDAADNAHEGSVDGQGVGAINGGDNPGGAPAGGSNGHGTP